MSRYTYIHIYIYTYIHIYIYTHQAKVQLLLSGGSTQDTSLRARMLLGGPGTTAVCPESQTTAELHTRLLHPKP